MVLEDIVKLIVDNGISVVCVVYMIYFQSTTMKEMLNALTSINDRLTRIELKLEDNKDEV